MNSYLDLVTEYNRIHHKKNRIIIACIALAVCLVTAIFGMTDIAAKFETEQLKHEFGSYHIRIKNMNADDAILIKSRADVAYSGWVQVAPSVEYEGKEFRVIGGDEETATQLGLSVAKGKYPRLANEALVDRQALTNYGWIVGETIKINMGDAGDKEYKIVGVFNEFSSLKSKDSHGLFLSTEGVQAIAPSRVSDYYITFKDNVNITKATTEVQNLLGIDESQVSKNEYLLTAMGQGGSSFAMNMYFAAGVLFILVLIAGCIMISNSFNMNVMEQIKFFGLMRCLGGSKKQIKKYVMREGIQFSLKGIPLGLITGSLVIEVAVILLRQLNPSLFGKLRVFQFSIIGLAAGIIVGFLTVILASLSPAKKASLVSPLAAVSGNLEAGGKKLTKNAVASTDMPIDLSMGIHHAFESKKSFLLMVGSFTLSIVLFLGFSVFIDFAYQAATPMRPETADISICDSQLNKLVPQHLLDEIQKVDGVKNAFGRNIATLSADSRKGKNGNVFVISYNDLQFDWVKTRLVSGNIDSVCLKSGEMVLAESDSGLNVGDPIVFRTKSGDFKTEVGGVLSSIPFDTKEQVIGKVIVSNDFFTKMTGISDYSIIDIQLLENASESTITSIRKSVPVTLSFMDKRQKNQETQNSFYTMAIFAYGFVGIIAVITLLNIISSMNISVISRTDYYGMMRAVGTSVKQLKRMILTEALTYAVCGSVVGDIIGITLHKILFEKLVTSYFYVSWQIPWNIVLSVILAIIVITIISVITPMRKINKLNIIDAVNAQ